jgi:hypothetical protein
MSEIYFKEIFEYPIEEFRNHLENNSNEKIIFSGKYGIGKTRFLQDYFELESNQEKYDVYKLFPVNYSISQNEDILQYIKYDILGELLLKKSSIEEFDLDFAQTLPVYIKENLFKVISGAMFMIPKIGKDLADFYEKFEKLKAEFIGFHNKKKTSDADIVVEYLEKLEEREGSIYENNVITKIITNTITKAKPKESILIVDDIDRLDPEHVFRILNVFAAHFDSPTYSTQKNKFNFDKIIIVCDFNNIKNLFLHRYGTEIDFMGYIDKFYSSEIYSFDNKKAIFTILDRIFDRIKYLQKDDSADFISSLYFNNGLIKNLSVLLLERNFISLRSLLNLSKKTIPYHFEKIIIKQNNETVAHLIPIVIQLKLLKDILGDYGNMYKACETCLRNDDEIEDYANYFGLFMYILSSDLHNFSRRSNPADIEYTYLNKKMLIAPTFFFDYSRLKFVSIYEYKESANGSHDRGILLDISVNMFWQAMLDTIKKLNRLGFLN